MERFSLQFCFLKTNFCFCKVRVFQIYYFFPFYNFDVAENTPVLDPGGRVYLKKKKNSESYVEELLT